MTWLDIGMALWLGLLTAISPCPLASNIAAMSFIGKDVSNRRRVFLAGLAYSLGRSMAYVAMAALLVGGLIEAGEVSRLLQRYGAGFLGPVLILIGLLLLGWIGGGVSVQAGSQDLRQRLAKAGLVGAWALGVLFALSFCPVSAGLFFGMLIPLAMQAASPLLLPSLFGLSTAMPVVVFALLLAFSAQAVGRTYHGLKRVEAIVQLTFGSILILIGCYYSLTLTYHLL